MGWKPALFEVFAAIWHKLESFVPGFLGAVSEPEPEAA